MGNQLEKFMDFHISTSVLLMEIRENGENITYMTCITCITKITPSNLTSYL